MARLFVYGSLKLGQPNHHVLVQSEWLGEARTTHRYTLVNLGEYPAMLLGGMTAIEGEVYEVASATLRELDRLEEHPRVFERVRLPLATGEWVFAYRLLPHWRQGAREIPSGRWPVLTAPGES